MAIAEVSGIGDAIFHLTKESKRRWTEAEFTRMLIRLRLPLFGVAPAGISIVAHDYVDGRLVITARPDLHASYVTLLQDEIEQLARGGQTITDRPAWLFGDEPYYSWSEICAFRSANHRVLNYEERDEGEWMGQSTRFFFEHPIGITPVTTLGVPRHTLAELLKADAQSSSRETYKSEQSSQTTSAMNDVFAPKQLTEIVRPAGITKDQVITAFAHLLPIKDLSGALADGKGTYGAEGARVQRGTRDKRHAALWDPVYLAVTYYERYRLPLPKLNRVFTDNNFLLPWLETWRSHAEDM